MRITLPHGKNDVSSPESAHTPRSFTSVMVQLIERGASASTYLMCTSRPIQASGVGAFCVMPVLSVASLRSACLARFVYAGYRDLVGVGLVRLIHVALVKQVL